MRERKRDMSEKHENLAAALAAFQGELTAVHKSNRAKVPTKSGGEYSYTYADLADVAQAVYPLLSKHGLAFVCQPDVTATGGWLLRGNLLHEGGDRVEGSLPIHGNTPQDYGSALTYMRRYLLGCLTGVVTDDDDDGAAATRAVRPSQQQPRREDPRRQESQSPQDPQRALMFAEFTHSPLFPDDPRTAKGREHRLAYMVRVVGRDVKSTNDLTQEEVGKVLDALRADRAEWHAADQAHAAAEAAAGGEGEL